MSDNALAPSNFDALKSKLKELNVKIEDNVAPEQLAEIATKELNEIHAILKNSLIVTDHTLSVFTSMAERGAYPAELLKGSKEFLGREGWGHLKLVLAQLISRFKLPSNETTATPTAVDNKDAETTTDETPASNNS